MNDAEKPPHDMPTGLARWSARKRQTQRRAEAETEQPPAEPQPAELTDADMPPLESIDETSDLSGFFSSRVSPELRRRALRRLFSLPAYNIRDGLNDYDDDFTRFEPLGNTVTADMRHQLELREQRERQRLAEQQAAEPPPPARAEAQPAAEDAESVELQPDIDAQAEKNTPPADEPPDRTT